MQITVNGKRFDVSAEHVSYEDIALLAGKPDDKCLTVVYEGRQKDDRHRAGTLVPGRSIDAEDGMIFEAIRTDSA